MQEVQGMQELNEEDLELVTGGSYHYAFTSASVNVSASANGGFYHIDRVFGMTESVTVTNSKGMSASFAFGFAFAVAL